MIVNRNTYVQRQRSVHEKAPVHQSPASHIFLHYNLTSTVIKNRLSYNSMSDNAHTDTFVPLIGRYPPII